MILMSFTDLLVAPRQGHIFKIINFLFIVSMIQNLLRKDPEAGLLDLGANIGVYTLSIAKMARKVRQF